LVALDGLRLATDQVAVIFPVFFALPAEAKINVIAECLP
jgi:hypothetical protein